MSTPWLVRNELNNTYWMNQIVRLDRVRFLETPIKLCLLLEGILIVFILIQLVCYIFIMIIWQPYHINLRILGTGQFISFGVGMSSRLAMILYESELIPHKTLADFPLPFLNVFRLWNYNMVFQIPLTITVERYFATKLLSDYEKQNRPWIGALIMGPVMGMTLAMSTLSVNGEIDGNKATAVSMLPIAIFVCLFRRLLRVNESEMDRLHQLFEHRRSSAVYTLSLRVQLNENISVMQAIKGPLLLLLLSTPIDIAAISLPSFLITVETDYWMLDVCSAAANLIVAMQVLSAATVAPVVAYHFIHYHRNRVVPFTMHFSKMNFSPYAVEERSDESIHFSMLHNQWELSKKFKI